jgi:CBS domain-containing protein
MYAMDGQPFLVERLSQFVSMPVIADKESKKLVGMITDRDLCCSIIARGLDPNTTQIEKFITPTPASCREGENVEAYERLMQEHQVKGFPSWMRKTA